LSRRIIESKFEGDRERERERERLELQQMEGLVEDGSKDGRWSPGIDSCGGGSRGSRGSWCAVVLYTYLLTYSMVQSPS